MDSQRNPSDHEPSSIDPVLQERLNRLAEDIKKLSPDRLDQVEKLLKRMSKKVVSIKEAAEILDVSQDTIRRAIQSKSLVAFQISKKGIWRIPIEELDNFLRRGKSA